MKRFAFIDRWKKAYSIERLCRGLCVTFRGFRAWRSRPMSQRQRVDMLLLAHIREAYWLSHKTYGRPHMVEELREMGLAVGHRRIGRLMRDNGIRAVRTRKYKATTNSHHSYNVAPNLLGRDFTADTLNQKWSVDMSYIWTREGWRSPSLEPMAEYSPGRCDGSTFQAYYWLGCQQSYAPQAFPLVKRELAIRALQMAITLRRSGCIHHSDRWSQYCSKDYQALLAAYGFEVLMSSKGNCYKRAACPWGTMPLSKHSLKR